jgi:DNA repair ATPase RecN
VLPISLLSGGQRTLTALAILFAVFRSQPSPFCILDEVDAALDDANIGRFLTLLTATLDETQFVVVTHNKGTMAACNLLYGVTMAVRGVSHVVSVELAQVDDVIPAAARGRDGGAPPAAHAAPLGNGAGAAEAALESVPDPAGSEAVS